MTRNQIEWYKAKTGRLEYEESKRHNIAGEAVAMNNYLLGERSQSEVERHNLVVEGQSAQSIAVARQQAAASMLGAQASMAGAAAAMVNAQAAKLNADTNAALAEYQKETESQRASMYAEQASSYAAQASKYTTEAIGQRIENVHAGEVRASELAVNSAQANYYTIMAQEKPRENDIREASNWMNFTSNVYGSTTRAITDVYNNNNRNIQNEYFNPNDYLP